MERKYYKDGVEAPQQKETENGIIYNYNSEANHDMLIADGYMQIDDDAPQIPPTVTSRQIRLQLTQLGISLSSIDDMLNQLPEPQKTSSKIQWEYSGIFERNNPILIQLAGQMGIDEQQLDQLFINANSL